jgi:hypothetical protein
MPIESFASNGVLIATQSILIHGFMCAWKSLLSTFVLRSLSRSHVSLSDCRLWWNGFEAVGANRSSWFLGHYDHRLNLVGPKGFVWICICVTYPGFFMHTSLVSSRISSFQGMSLFLVYFLFPPQLNLCFRVFACYSSIYACWLCEVSNVCVCKMCSIEVFVRVDKILCWVTV